MMEKLDKIIEAVHRPLNFSDYNETSIREDTNCFSHAIGSTITCCRSLYRLGRISGKKKLDEKYVSSEELKNLFLFDTAVLGLKAKEISYDYVKKNDKIELKDNQHVVVLFACYHRNEIYDFHFIRFDQANGWTEKRWKHSISSLNMKYSWPESTWTKYVAAFIITR